MTPLTILLSAKILNTMVLVIIPFLFLQPQTLDRLSGFGQPNRTMYRLYGMAILALVVAYSGGLLQTLAGVFPSEIVAMGLASNVGATLVMVLTGYARTHRIATAFFGLIGLGFAAAAAFPGASMQVLI